MFRTLLLAIAIVSANVSAATPEVPRGKLPRQVVPTAYEVNLRMDARADRYSGMVRIDLDVKEATDHFFIHARGSSLHDLQLTHANIATITAKSELVDAAGGVVRVDSATPISGRSWRRCSSLRAVRSRSARRRLRGLRTRAGHRHCR